jgi:hypothetical protein
MIGPGKMRDVRTALAANRAPPDVAKKLGNYPELGRVAFLMTLILAIKHRPEHVIYGYEFKQLTSQ